MFDNSGGCSTVVLCFERNFAPVEDFKALKNRFCALQRSFSLDAIITARFPRGVKYMELYRIEIPFGSTRSGKDICYGTLSNLSTIHILPLND